MERFTPLYTPSHTPSWTVWKIYVLIKKTIVHACWQLAAGCPFLRAYSPIIPDVWYRLEKIPHRGTFSGKINTFNTFSGKKGRWGEIVRQINREINTIEKKLILGLVLIPFRDNYTSGLTEDQKCNFRNLSKVKWTTDKHGLLCNSLP